MPDPELPPIVLAEAPKPPRPAKPPDPPRAATPPTSDPKTMARNLINEMKKNKGAADLKPYSPAQMVEVEKALTAPGILGKGEADRYGYSLRTMLRFARAEAAGLLKVLKSTDYKIVGGAAPKPTTTKIPAGSVDIQLNVSTAGIDKGTTFSLPEKSAFILTFKGTTAGVHWLQFFWRGIRIIYPPADKGGKPRESRLQMRIDRAGRTYSYSTDPANPRWSTDGNHPDSPFYEGEFPVKRKSDSLAMMDVPSANEFDVAHLFASSSPPDQCISKFVAAAYLVRGREVLYRADLVREWTISLKAGTKVVIAEPKPWVGKGAAAERIEAEHRSALARQFPKWDYFPGPRIPAPTPMPSFEPLSPAHPDITGWKAQDVAVERYRAAARAANAKLVEDVEIDKYMLPIVRDTPATQMRGLNYVPALGAKDNHPGEAGYVYEGGAYDGKRMPHDRFGAFPRVAMSLGMNALQWGTARPGDTMPNARDKFYTLATLRHEMAHGAHASFALGWLLKWRDELTAKDFERWFKTQGKVSDVDQELVLTNVAPTSKRATEALAYAEGVLTALQFLPSPPKVIAAYGEKANWPAALSELSGYVSEVLEKFVLSKEIESAVNARLKSILCGSLDKTQRKLVTDWIDLLLALDPKTISDPDEQKAAKYLNGFFGTQKAKPMLKNIRAIAAKCPS